MLPSEEEIVRPRPSMVGFGPFTFDRANGLLRLGIREIPLPPRVLGVLDLLISRPGEIIPKQEIIDSIWKEAFVTDTSLAEAISALRQALGDDPQAPRYVQTIHRRGYRFIAPVGPVSSPATEPALTAGERTSPSIGGRLVLWGVAVLCGILAVTTVWEYTHLPAPLSPVVRMRIEPAAGTVFDGRAAALALSPDGIAVAWAGCDRVCRLYVRDLDQLESRPLPGTDGAGAPFFSPDGRWIGFFAGGKLRKVALSGGVPITLAEAAHPFGAVWTPDGQIVFAASEYGGLLRVSDRGGDAEQVTLPSANAGEVRHAWPSLAPGGRALLFTIATSPLEGAVNHVALMPLGQRAAWQTIINGADSAVAASPDYVAFLRANEVHAVAFDRARQTITGVDQVVIGEVARAQFAIAQSGATVYAIAAEAGTPALEWAAPFGSAARSEGATRSEGGAPALPSTLSADLAALQASALSPDGSRIVGIAGPDIWAGDIPRGTTTRLTHGGVNVAPVWSADGADVYYATSNGGAFETWMRDAAGASLPRQILSAAGRHRHTYPSSLARDARLLAYTESGGPTRSDVKVIAIGDGTTIAEVQTPYDETDGRLSPDGRLLAYQSDESGRWEVYVLRIVDKSRLSISSSGGTGPLWSPDGGALFYRAGDRLVSVPIDGSSGAIGTESDVMSVLDAAVAGIAPDRRVLIRRNGDHASQHAVLTLEWARELRRMLVPPAATLPR